ncbi:MAG: tRNA (adenosine(37)-N6)-dimethylallyltransferase MiaA [Proteobacteria bacterium]|nr:tRNA (adenosine(37)-N6)-dimethylallyltransferase MiaA [Pseudomonadota bacterium]
MENNAERRPRLLVIAGPTASGKTSLAVEVALACNAEIVGADSMQVYRKLDIGTAKPTPEELRGVRHHLIDVVDPDEPFDAARFVTLADQAIEEISGRGRRVIVVGGTGLYIRVLLHGLHQGPPPSSEVRERLLKRGQSEGWPALHEELILCDPKSASRLHPNDGVRILRALEVLEVSGIPISEWQLRHGFVNRRYQSLILGISRVREELYKRIDERIDKMMDSGFQNEVKRLLSCGYEPELKPLQGLGYRHLAACAAGDNDLKEVVKSIKTDTRRFAKRQLTWFKKEPGLVLVNPDKEAIVDRAELFWQASDQNNYKPTLNRI